MVESSLFKKISSLAYILIFLIILTISLTVLFLSLKYINFIPGPDESYYFNYAKYINDKGISGFAYLFRDYVENKEKWIYPSPIRIGFIILSSLLLKLFGNSVLNLVYLSLFSYALFLGISLYFLRKYFDERIALLTMFILTFSPLNMAMAKRALIESTLNMFSALSLWLFWEFLRERSCLKYILFTFTFFYTILIKETAVLLSPFFIIFLLFRKVFLKRDVYLKDYLCASILPFAMVGIVYIILGGFSYIVETIKISLYSPKTNPYALSFQSGPWYRYIIDFLLLSPGVVILTIGFIFSFSPAKADDELLLYLLLMIVTIFFLFNIFSKSVRFIIILDMPMRLFSVLMLKNLSERIFLRHGRAFWISLVIIISLLDFINFYHLFVYWGIYDPVSYFLLKAKHMIP
ncbi:MAG: glycosyltransferase family 39 protein [Candidatus Omnitrophica bacterium]|nr:glycosyltransferase family 39 protein [Candidatus Omnitrophota bacterium]MCM8793072.1 glycosyltransferase family 39 protein [Candidatus Omnitrophota bacterium]